MNTRPQDMIARLAKVNLKDTSKILRALMVYSLWKGEKSIPKLLIDGTKLKPDVLSTFHFRPNEQDVAACTETFGKMLEDFTARGDQGLIDDIRNSNCKTYFFSVNNGAGHITASGQVYPEVVGVVAGSTREAKEFLKLLDEHDSIEFDWNADYRRENR